MERGLKKAELQVGKMYPFYRYPEKETRSTFEGWGEVLEITEHKETFLIGNDLWQLVRVKVKFTADVPSGCERGRLNDPFVSKPFITHKIKRTLRIPNASDKEIVENSYTPLPRKAKLGDAYYDNLRLNEAYESNFQFQNTLDVTEALLEPEKGREIIETQLPHCREPQSSHGGQSFCSAGKERQR